MTCNCANKGQIPICPESPFGRIGLVLGVTIASFVYTKLPAQGKVLIGSLGVTGLSYAFGLHEKINNLLFVKHEDASFNPASQLSAFEELKALDNSENSETHAIKDGKYKGLSLIICSAKADTITINFPHQMHKIDGYISEVQGFDPQNDKIQIHSQDAESMDLQHKIFEGIDYTIVYLHTQGEELHLAVQGAITEQNIEFI